jgi:hypothetical protein
MILTREDLHRRVWAMPMPAVANELGLTSAELTRLCRDLDVPFPYSGYWRKGAPLDGRTRALRRVRPGYRTQVDLDVPTAAHASPPPSAAPSSPAGTSLAPNRLPNAAPGPPGEPATSRAPSSAAENLLDLRYGLIHARLREGIERAGHALRRADGEPGFEVKGQAFGYWVREGYTRTKRPPTAKEARDHWIATRGYVFEERMTGRFILAVQAKAYGRKVEWRDRSRHGRLEDRIDEIVADLEALADEITRHDAERRAAEARWREAEARRQAAERQAQAKADRWNRLCRLADQHERTRRVAVFLTRLRAEAGPAAGGDPTLRAWFAWAQDAVAAYDPTTWDMAQVMRCVDRPPRWRSRLEPEDEDEDDDEEP